MRKLNVTGDEVRAAALAAGITQVEHHRCSICGHMVRWLISGDRLYFSSACGCSYSPPEPRSWSDAADEINMQDRSGEWGDVAAKHAARFGLTLAPNDSMTIQTPGAIEIQSRTVMGNEHG